MRRCVTESLELLECRTLCAATELIANGSLPDATGWTLTGDWRVDSVYSTTNGHSNPGYAYLAKNGSLAQSLNTSGSLAQTVTIPSATADTLSFYTKFTTEETPASTNDQLKVVIRTAGGTLLSTLATFNATTDSAYNLSTIDVSAFAGQTVTLGFEGSTNATLGTVFRLDDVSLLATPLAALVAPTPITPGVLSGTAPTINSPIATLRWNPVSKAAGYGVQLQTVIGGPFGNSSIVFDSEASSFSSPLVGTSLTVPKTLAQGVTYRWHVRAFDASGNVTGYSPWMTFTVNPSGYNRAVGIDISDFQTITSWAQIKNNNTTSTTSDDTSFIYTKATEGTSFTAGTFPSYFDNSAANGIATGAYHFARPGNNSALREATFFFNTIKSRLAAGSLVPMLDFEDPHANTVALSVATLSQWVGDFEDAFSRLSGGIVPIVYTFVSYATDHLDASVAKYPLWMAQYPTSSANPTIPVTSGAPSGTSPWPANAWAMWQYTSNRTVAGINSDPNPNVDSDVSNSDFATFYDQFKIRSNATGSISGTVFNDLHSDGVRDASEPGIAGRTVWIDADDDGVLDNGETTAVTNAAGAYSFAGLLEGAYKVRQVVPAGYVGTAPAGAVAVVVLTPGLAVSGKMFGTRSLDTTPPTIASADFDYAGASHVITLTPSEALASGTFTASDVTLLDANGVAVPFTYAFDGTTATLTPTDALANGSYRVAVAAGAFSDVAGNANAAYTFDFFQLAGDVNRDRNVDFNDLLILAKNYGATGLDYAGGDLTGDGAVDFGDLLVLARNYGKNSPTLAPVAARFAIASTTPIVQRRRVATTIL